MPEKTEFQAGEDVLGAFYSAPAGDGPAPGVILASAIAGINDYVKRAADRLAAAGFATLLIDYYSREGAAPDVSTPQKIGEAVAGLSDPRTLSDINFAIEHLRNLDGVDAENIATLGFCIGGMYAYLAACDENGLKAAVDYYGLIRYSDTNVNKPVSPLDKAADLKAPLLAHFGDFDRLISASDIEDFKRALQENQKPYEMYVYGGAPHAFDEDFRAPVYRPVASAEAWRRSINFLDWHLKRRAPR